MITYQFILPPPPHPKNNDISDDDISVCEKFKRDIKVTSFEGTNFGVKLPFNLYDLTKIGGLKYVSPTIICKEGGEFINNELIGVGRKITEAELINLYKLFNKLQLQYKDPISYAYRDVGLSLACDNASFAAFINTYNSKYVKLYDQGELIKTVNAIEYRTLTIKNQGSILTDEDKLVIFDIVCHIKTITEESPDYNLWVDKERSEDGLSVKDYNFMQNYKLTNFRVVDKSFNEDYLFYLYVQD